MTTVEEIKAERVEFLNTCIKNEQTSRDWHSERIAQCDKRIEELAALRDEIIENQNA